MGEVVMNKIIFFHAPWCTSCHAFEKTLDEFIRDVPDSIYLDDVDIEKDENAVEKHKIMSIPTLVFMDGEREVGRMKGNVGLQELKELFSTLQK